MLAFELGSTKWTLGVHDGARAAPAHSDDAGRGPARAGEGDPAGEGAVWAAARRARAQLLRGGPGWILAPPVVDHAGRGERRGGFLEHRSQSAGAPGEDRSAGCRQVVGAAPAVARGGTQGLECRARPVAGGRSAAPADAGDRDGARGSETRAQSDPVVAGDARHPARTARDGSWRTWPRCRPATAGRCRRRSASGSNASGRTWTPSRRG